MTDKTPLYLTPLYVSLNAAFPDHRSVRGLLDVHRLAADAGFSGVAIYHALKRGYLLQNMADRLVAVSKNRLSMAEIAAHVRTREETRQKKAA